MYGLSPPYPAQTMPISTVAERVGKPEQVKQAVDVLQRYPELGDHFGDELAVGKPVTSAMRPTISSEEQGLAITESK